MQLHQLRPKHKIKKGKRIGRGGKRGTYAGKGVKGQKSRAGKKLQPGIREWIKKYPKLKGYRFKAQEKNIVVLNIDVLERKFNAQDIVSPQTLIKKGVISKIKGRIPRVKILGRGKLTKKLIIKNCQVSKTVKKKLESI